MSSALALQPPLLGFTRYKYIIVYQDVEIAIQIAIPTSITVHNISVVVAGDAAAGISQWCLQLEFRRRPVQCPPLDSLWYERRGWRRQLVCVIVVEQFHRTGTRPHAHSRHWPIQDMRLLVCVCARINHPLDAPAHSHYPHYCNTSARLLRNVWHPPDPPFLCHTSYNIGNANIVLSLRSLSI